MAKTSVTKKRSFRIGIFVGFSLAVLVGLLYGAHAMSVAMFTGNPHFVLRDVKVSSAGWWGGRVDAALAAAAERSAEEGGKPLEIVVGRTNLFSLDLRDVRGALESEPGIASVVVRRILPDTLDITISERIPRAALKCGEESFLVDQQGVVFHGDRAPRLNLPEISRLPASVVVEPGERLAVLNPALELISLTRGGDKFAVFDIEKISLAEDGLLNVLLSFHRGSNSFWVTLPDESIGDFLEILRQTIATAIVRRHLKHRIRMDYKGQVVVGDIDLGELMETFN